MKGRGRWAILAALTAAIGAVGLAAVLGEGQASSTELKVSQDVLEATAEGGTASFVVYLDDQADVQQQPTRSKTRTRAAGTSTRRFGSTRPRRRARSGRSSTRRARSTSRTGRST